MAWLDHTETAAAEMNVSRRSFVTGGLRLVVAVSKALLHGIMTG